MVSCRGDYYDGMCRTDGILDTTQGSGRTIFSVAALSAAESREMNVIEQHRRQHS